MLATSTKVSSVVVGVGDLQVADVRGTLVTHGLGSCVAVCVLLPSTGWGALLHFMLPSSRIDPRRAERQPALFSDTGIAALFGELASRGSLVQPVVKIVGGASTGLASGLDMGKRNVLAARKQLWHRSFAIAAEEVEGSISRTVHFEVATGRVRISTPNQPERVL